MLQSLPVLRVRQSLEFTERYPSRHTALALYADDSVLSASAGTMNSNNRQFGDLYVKASSSRQQLEVPQGKRNEKVAPKPQLTLCFCRLHVDTDGNIIHNFLGLDYVNVKIKQTSN